MNILVTGANGQLGSELKVVSNFAIGDTYIFTDISELDITNKDAIQKFIKNFDIKVIVNCAAYTNVEKAEDNEFNAELINSTAVKYLAESIKEVNGTLIHISTDYVFDGTANIPINEDVKTNPIGVYGKTKLNGENNVINSGCNYIILRTSWLYSTYGHNFVKTIINASEKNESIKVVIDQIGTPTYANDLAHAIFYIIDTNLYEDCKGIYHYSNEGVCSWYDFASEIVSACNNNCKVNPCFSDEYKTKVKRPSYSVLDKSKFKNTFLLKIPHWRKSLNNCLNKLKSY